MSTIKISEFAHQIGIEPHRLVKQLSDAGVTGKSKNDTLNDQDKRQLLDFLRGEVKAINKPSLDGRGKLSFKKKSEYKVERTRGTLPQKIPGQTEKRRTFIKREQLEAIEEQQVAVADLVKAKGVIESLKKKLDQAEENLRVSQNNNLTTEAEKTNKEQIDLIRPRVFISYSYDSLSHKSWVKEFSSILVKNGIETMLDQWSLHPGDSLTEFMKNGISESNFVLIICTEEYKKKSDSNRGGVGYEDSIISSDIFESSNHRKYIPILKSKNRIQAIPITLASKVFLDFSNIESENESLTDLLLTLYGRRLEAPALGSVPDFKRLRNVKD